MEDNSALRCDSSQMENLGKKRPRTTAKAQSAVEILATNVKLLRTMRKWSQEELGSRCGMARTEISVIERGARVSGIAAVEKLAVSLGVETWELLRPRNEDGR